MTIEEFKKIPFHFTSHLSMADEHCTTYESDNGRIKYCQCVPFKNGEPYGKGYTHYMIDGKVYKTQKKFLEALKDFKQ